MVDWVATSDCKSNHVKVTQSILSDYLYNMKPEKEIHRQPPIFSQWVRMHILREVMSIDSEQYP